MMCSNHSLELCNVFHSGQVGGGTCIQRVFGSCRTGAILKDVSLIVKSGEVLAVLGSKGSGKKALLDVISHRVGGATRGQILLNKRPLSQRHFQQRCGYVTHKCDVIKGLTVEQILFYTPTKLTGYLKKSKVKQVMADLALSQVANRSSENLSQSEYRRLVIGIQLIKDPDVLLLDEPTWDLDPLNTYLIISILSNAAKKYSTAVILTMEKPRSDVFPFLERVLYLCLGDVVYTGGTRHMLEYFTSIGFPCPHLENPLMYYLCLSTVDRRSRERFLESNSQIAALVEKFKLEGGMHKKSTQNSLGQSSVLSHENKMAREHNKLSAFHVGWLLITRLLTAIFNMRGSGLKQLFLRLFLVPSYFLMMWFFYRDMTNFQHTFNTRSGLILNCLCGMYFLAIVNTILIYPMYRTRYYQESQDGTYGGLLFVITYDLVTLPFSLLSVVAASAVVYSLIGSLSDLLQLIYFAAILWACYIFSEQQTMAILLIVRNHLTAAICSVYMTCISITLSSGLLRSFKGLQDWMLYLSYALQPRYASAYLNRQIFLSPVLMTTLPYDNKNNCNGTFTQISPLETNFIGGSSTTNTFCKFINGQSFLTDRYGIESSDFTSSEIVNQQVYFGITYAFAIGMIVFNLFLYAIPLPTRISAKFRD